MFNKKNKFPIHIIFCFVDHFEPKWEKPSKDIENARVEAWLQKYPVITNSHMDSDGKRPQHTWFYPAEEYEYEHLEKLAWLCQMGYGEIELHLHHDNDTPEGVRNKINDGIINYTKHGAFGFENEAGKIRYGFIHGNWALNNSDARGINCGVNDEITILLETGCYADFTLPAAPSSCQTRKINSIYYAFDNPLKPKSHNTGVDVEVGRKQSSGLMIIQGPLTLDWKRRKYGIIPRIENGEISGRNPGTPERVDNWVRQNIRVVGKEDWVFLKVHCHGAQERDWDALLGNNCHRLFEYLETKYNDGKSYKLHYVTARECYNIVKAAEAGEIGNPNMFRDYLIKRQSCEDIRTVKTFEAK